MLPWEFTMDRLTEPHPTSYVVRGRTVTLPCVVRDASSGTAIFAVPAAAAQRLLPGDAFEIVETEPGRTQLLLGFVDYRDNDLGDYHEVMVIFFVRPGGAPLESQGTFIYKLPVNQSFTCEAGRLIWGFPKTVDDIDVDYHDHHVTCRLAMNGEHVFTLRLPRVADGVETPDVEMTTYTYLDGPCAVPFVSGGTSALVPGGGTVELGTHPLAAELRGLGLPCTPLMSTWMEHMHGSFGQPVRIGR